MDPDSSVSPRKKAERFATWSSCCGVTGEVTLTDSAVVILYAGALGAGEFWSLATTAVLPFCNGVLLLPFACGFRRVDGRRLMRNSCMVATAAYLLAVAAPWFGSGAVVALLSALLGFAVAIPGFIAGWFPLLDTFVSASRRTAFLGCMRFFHQLTAVGFLLAVSAFAGKTPSVAVLQLILLGGALIFAGREFFLSRIPVLPTEVAEEALPWRVGLRRAWRNHRLGWFSVYEFWLNLALFGMVPLAMLYLKQELAAGDNTVIAVSAAALGGMLLGYLGAAPLLRRWGEFGAFWRFHGFGVILAFLLGWSDCSGKFGVIWLSLLLAAVNFTIAATSVFCSAVMMRLASPGNKRIAMAWCGSFYYLGGGAARLVAPALLGLGCWRENIGAFRPVFLILGVTGLTAFPLLYFRVRRWLGGRINEEGPCI